MLLQNSDPADEALSSAASLNEIQKKAILEQLHKKEGDIDWDAIQVISTDKHQKILDCKVEVINEGDLDEDQKKRLIEKYSRPLKSQDASRSPVTLTSLAGVTEKGGGG